MKRFSILITLLTIALSASAQNQEPLDRMISRSLELSIQQSKQLYNTLEALPDRFPRTFENGKLVTEDYRWWVSGFFPGVLWQLYEYSGDGQLLAAAREMTRRVEPAKRMTDTHDLGFMLYCSFGHGYRITGDSAYLDVIKEGTGSLLTRWNPQIGVIKSWESSPRWKYPVIIDNMMNLEMLCFMTRETGDRQYQKIACRHADTTIKNHFREDYSCFHVVSYDPATGQPHAKNTAQGYADDSAWARGQAWGLYGYTMMYRETLEPRYLEQARCIASYLIPRLPEDKVPYWDYGAPAGAPRDASAAAVMASALLELSTLDPTEKASLWYDTAVGQLRSLSSDRYLASPGTNGGFILLHSTGNYPANSEVDVPLTYADYYYVEALMRLKSMLEKPDGQADRAEWVASLTKIASPVLRNLAAGTLKENMPFESLSDDPNRKMVSYLEAFGRTVCGIAPWLELGPDGTPEGQLRQEYIDLTLKALANAVDPRSKDCLDFYNEVHRQPLVDAAFLAEGLLRAPTQLWGRLDKTTRDRLVTRFKETRIIEPYRSNWFLFTSIIEAALLEFTGECDMSRLRLGVDQFVDGGWYKGDGWYSDGDAFHLDYYNSLVIHPMLTEVAHVMAKHGLEAPASEQDRRIARLAEQLQRMISPEGTFPVVGRSIAYRFGALHALADAALLGLVPDPAAARCAMTAVLRRQVSAPRTFDAEGWLRVGFSGSQVEISEDYINTGSCYLCTAFFLPLGLPAHSAFWSAPARDWSGKRAWNGAPVRADHAL